MTSRWDTGAIEYNDQERIKSALVGRSIVATHSKDLNTYSGEVDLVLDNGDILTAYEADGGCACNNGCFNLEPKLSSTSTIMNVEVIEESDKYDGGVIRLFVYTELGKQELLTSEGTDNGYYGWGYHLYLKTSNEENR